MAWLKLKLFILIIAALLTTGVNLRADELLPVININTVPDIVFSDQIIHVRISTGFNREAPKLRMRRITRITYAEVTVVLTSPGMEPLPLEVVPAKVEIPPYNDTTVPIRFAIPPELLKTTGLINITLKTDNNEVKAAITLRQSHDPGEDLHSQGAHLYDQNGARAILTIDRYNEAAYRLWAVPKAIKRWWTLSSEGGAAYLTPYTNGGKGIIPCMNDKNGSHPPVGKPDIIEEQFFKANYKLRVISPKYNNNAPILGLLAEVGKFQPNNEVAIIIDPGIEDILFGTPLTLYKNALQALVSRIEWLYPAESRDIYFVLPAPPAGLSERGRAYKEAALSVATERHLALLSGPHNSSRDSLYLYPTKKVQTAFARQLIKKTDLNRKRELLYFAITAFIIAAIIFIVVQLWTRHRLRKLVKYTCGE